MYWPIPTLISFGNQEYSFRKMTHLFRAKIYSTLEIYFFTSNLVIFWRKKKSWFEVQLSFQILNATYLDFYTCTNISGFILRAIVRTISINVSWVLMFILYFVNAQVPSNCSKHFQREICKKKNSKSLWFFCNRLKKLQNPTRQTKNRYRGRRLGRVYYMRARLYKDIFWNKYWYAIYVQKDSRGSF